MSVYFTKSPINVHGATVNTLQIFQNGAQIPGLNLAPASLAGEQTLQFLYPGNFPLGDPEKQHVNEDLCAHSSLLAVPPIHMHIFNPVLLGALF